MTDTNNNGIDDTLEHNYTYTKKNADGSAEIHDYTQKRNPIANMQAQQRPPVDWSAVGSSMASQRLGGDIINKIRGYFANNAQSYMNNIQKQQADEAARATQEMANEPNPTPALPSAQLAQDPIWKQMLAARQSAINTPEQTDMSGWGLESAVAPVTAKSADMDMTISNNPDVWANAEPPAATDPNAMQNPVAAKPLTPWQQFEEQNRLARVRMGVGGLGNAQNDEDRMQMLNRMIPRTKGTSELRNLQGQAGQVMAKQVSDQSQVQQLAKQKQVEDHAKIMQDLVNKGILDKATADRLTAENVAQLQNEGKTQVAGIEQKGNIDVAKVKASTDLVLADKSGATAVKVAEIGAKQKMNEAEYAGMLKGLVEANRMKQADAKLAMDKYKADLRAQSSGYGLGGEIAATSVAPATTAFKAGDTRTKNGVTYIRDATGNWNPVKG